MKERIKISDKAHISLNIHRLIDKRMEEFFIQGSKLSIGTTNKGIGPTYASKSFRNGIRFEDILLLSQKELQYKIKGLCDYYSKLFDFTCNEYNIQQEIDTLLIYVEDLFEKNMIVDGITYIDKCLNNGNVLAEGANATMLDIDFGTYPFVTSSSTCIGGVLNGLGVSHKNIGKSIGVIKAYTTRVGNGSFVTELPCDIGDYLQKEGNEYGVTTGRKRRCGWLDLHQISYSIHLTGVDSLSLTKLDVLDYMDSINICIGYNSKKNDKIYPKTYMPNKYSEMDDIEPIYIEMPGWNEKTTYIQDFEDLPLNAKNYVLFIQNTLGVHIEYIGNGPSRENVLVNI